MKQAPSVKRTNRTPITVVVLIAAIGLILAGAGWPTEAANRSIKYNFSQSQTQLSLRLESSHEIKSSQWSYAGPLNDRSKCSNRTFGDLPENIKGKADVTVPTNNPKIGTIKIQIQRSDNNKYYCLLAEGYPIARLIDYNPPVISLEDSNHLKARDVFKGAHGPNGTVDSKSWQAAVFDVSRKSDSYSCNAENGELNFRPTPADIKYVGQYSWGNDNHVSYNVPAGNVQFIVEFFESLKDALYVQPETDPTLIPFIDGEFNPAFTDNIHLCHRVSDPQGNTAYKLMHLDLGGPAIRLVLTGKRLQASSSAFDLDDSTWQYYKIPHRRQTAVCSYLDYPPEPTGKSAVIENVKNGDWYCFWALDKQGRRNTRLVQIDLGTPIDEPTPTVVPETTENSQAQEIDEPTPTVVPQPKPQQPVSSQQIHDLNQLPDIEVAEVTVADNNDDDQPVFDETAVTIQPAADADDSSYLTLIIVITSVVALAIATIVAIIIYNSAAKKTK